MKVYNYREIVKILRKNKFYLASQNGSHQKFRHNDGRTLVIKEGEVNRMVWQRLVKENRLVVNF